MAKILEIIGSTLSKHGLFPAVAILALIIGGYGCYQAHDNKRTIQQQAIDIARLEARLDASTKELSDRMGGVEKIAGRTDHANKVISGWKTHNKQIEVKYGKNEQRF